MTSNYRTRLRGRIEKQSAKYEEIFAAVVETTRSSLGSDSSDSSVLDSSFEKPATKSELSFGCTSCNSRYEKHSQLHAHIALEHGKALVRCARCNATSRTLWRSNVCRVCRSFAVDLPSHEATHYRDKEGDNALYECPHCYRTFTVFGDLKKHVGNVHRKSRTKKVYRCERCKLSFVSRHRRDQHLVSHYQSMLDNVWETLRSMQDRLGDVIPGNQCPLCQCVMCSKRSFRLHVIHRHLMRDFECLDKLQQVVNAAVKAEIGDGLGVFSAGLSFKVEKDESNEMGSSDDESADADAMTDEEATKETEGSKDPEDEQDNPKSGIRITSECTLSTSVGEVKKMVEQAQSEIGRKNDGNCESELSMEVSGDETPTETVKESQTAEDSTPLCDSGTTESQYPASNEMPLTNIITVSSEIADVPTTVSSSRLLENERSRNQCDAELPRKEWSVDTEETSILSEQTDSGGVKKPAARAVSFSPVVEVVADDSVFKIPPNPSEGRLVLLRKAQRSGVSLGVDDTEMLPSTSSTQRSDRVREWLIGECLERKGDAFYCTKCGTTRFARMYDFEIHLMREHVSLVFGKLDF